METPPASQWQRIAPGDVSGFGLAQALARRAAADNVLGARALDLEWRRGLSVDPDTLRVYLLRAGSGALGLAVFSRTQRALRFAAGEVTLHESPLTRFWHIGEPFIDPELDGLQAHSACTDLLAAAIGDLASSEALFFEGLPVGSPLRAALSGAMANPSSRLVKLELGGAFEHQYISLPSSFADYVAQLGSRSRQSVLYSQRRLRKDMDGAVRCECFESEASVERFVSDASAVSRNTYQWNLLGLGLRDSAELRQGLAASARAGWFRSFVLYCREVPVAFMLGYQHGRCYYYDDVGYDPDYAKHSVGSVLQIEVLEYLYGRLNRPATFDFSTGYGEHKRRFGNSARQEQNLLVLPATIRNRALLAAYRCTEVASAMGVRALDRLGLKAGLKRIIRRAAVRGGKSR